MYISVASTIREVDEYFLLKHSGMCNLTISLEGNVSSSEAEEHKLDPGINNLRYYTLAHSKSS